MLEVLLEALLTSCQNKSVCTCNVELACEVAPELEDYVTMLIAVDVPLPRTILSEWSRKALPFSRRSQIRQAQRSFSTASTSFEVVAAAGLENCIETA